MGGNAFNALLSSSSFPRLPPAVYNALKERLLPHIQNLYYFVAVPVEAPGKISYGDVDFVVACPKTGEVAVNIPHNVIQEAIGALYMNPMEGNRTSNFAVPVAHGEWASLNHASDEDEARQEAEEGEIFYQVDVNVCANKEEWDRIVFFHSYGDLGMILGVVVRNVGLTLSEKGLKYPDPPNKPVELSQSFHEILRFMGLSMDLWTVGFETKQEIFEWIGSSRFFDPQRFRSKGEGFRKVKPERKMYAEFVEWATAKATTVPVEQEKPQETKNIKEQALVYFNKREVFDTLARERTRRLELKQVFTGHKVRDWTELGEYWGGVKLIMDAVRERFGGDEGVLKIYEKEGEEGVRKIVVQVKEEVIMDRQEAL